MTARAHKNLQPERFRDLSAQVTFRGGMRFLSAVLVMMGAARVASAAEPQQAQALQSELGTFHQHGDMPGEIVVDVAPTAGTMGNGPVTVYVNRCAIGGCDVQPGTNDARENKSSLISGAINSAPYPYSNAAWQTTMNCVNDQFASFGVVVTDQDPGNKPHLEVLVTGSDPSVMGFPSKIGGVAPSNCSVVDNGMAFVYPRSVLGDPIKTCEIIAHEAGHMLGLEHTMLCSDPMSYKSCGAKSFANTQAACGTDGVAACKCGGSTQNSYEKLLQAVGPINPTPPTLDVTSPADGVQVDFGFAIAATASDNDSVERVEVYIGGTLVHTFHGAPYYWETPSDLRNGPTKVEIVAVDAEFVETRVVREIMLGTACSADEGCATGDLCVEGRCVAGPGVDGGLGDVCDEPSECESGVCVGAADGPGYCAEACNTSCPTGFACMEAGAAGSVCFPADGQGGGCSTSGSGSSTGFALLLLALGLVIRRKR